MTPDKKEEKEPTEVPKEESTKEGPKQPGKKYHTIQTGQNQKSVIITTDGTNVHVEHNNVNALEMEMMLTKVLSHIRGSK